VTIIRQGDSGGALECHASDNKWYANGLVSFGSMCGMGASYFADVQYYSKWIREAQLLLEEYSSNFLPNSNDDLKKLFSHISGHLFPDQPFALYLGESHFNFLKFENIYWLEVLRFFRRAE